MSIIQVYLVAGGATDTNTYTGSTEVLVDGAAFWTEAAPLPFSMCCQQAVSIDNYIISIGE